MDKKTLIISIVALVIAVGACAYTVIATCPSCKKSAAKSGDETREEATIEIAEGSIVYFQLDRVVKEYDMANDLTSVVETKMQNVHSGNNNPPIYGFSFPRR